MAGAVGVRPVPAASRALAPTAIGVLTLGCSMLAFVARLGRGGWFGGLWAYRGYDDGLYFAAADAFVHGLVPYRDFLLLHPPGIVLALTPVAALTYGVPDATALVVARVAWMVLGAVNTALIVRVAAPWGRRAALTAGLLYALLPVATGAEYLTMLEPWGTAALLGAVLLARRAGRVDAGGWWSVAVGALAAVGPVTKIWGVVPVALLVICHGRRLGPRAVLRAVCGAGATLALAFGPFAVLAGSRLWRDVVVDQLARPRTPDTVTQRIAVLAGLPLPGVAHRHSAAVAIVVLVVLVTCAIAAWRAGRARFWVVLGAVQVALLVVAPPVNSYYGAFVAPAMVLVVAAAVARSRAWSTAAAGAAVSAGVATVVIAMACPVTAPFPAAQVNAHLPDAACVRTDSPGVLLLLDRFTAQVEARCPLQLDVSGLALDLPFPTADGPAAMELNPRYQQAVVDYLGSGSTAVLVRRGGDGFSPRTLRRLEAGRRVVAVGDVTRVLEPVHTLAAATACDAREPEPSR